MLHRPSRAASRCNDDPHQRLADTLELLLHRASIDPAVEKVKAAGGAVHQGSHEVPGGQFIILGADPQGVAFAPVGGK